MRPKIRKIAWNKLPELKQISKFAWNKGMKNIFVEWNKQEKSFKKRKACKHKEKM